MTTQIPTRRLPRPGEWACFEKTDTEVLWGIG
jgi:hypothetical protein